MKAETPAAGRNSNFAAILYLAEGTRVFCKGVEACDDASRMHRLEARVGPWLPAPVPRLLWQIDLDGWLLLGFEYVSGRHAVLSPGSPDLPLIAESLSVLARELTPCPVNDVASLGHKMARFGAWQRLKAAPLLELDDWTRRHVATFAAEEPVVPELVAGNTLAHTDVHELNLLIDRSAHLVDWAWARVSAPWVDAAYLVIRLIQAGHSPVEAERWAATITGWREAPPVAVTAFAVEVYGMWEHLRLTKPAPFRDGPTKAARLWAQYRVDSVPGEY